jgi:hypothetical protein
MVLCDLMYPYYAVSVMYDSYLNRIGRMAIVWLYVLSFTVSHGLFRYCTVAYTIIYGHDIHASSLKV